jgi:hypothetical protein
MSLILDKWKNISKDIEGSFQNPGELVWDSLLEFQKEQGIIQDFLEIGVLHGKSASLTALYANELGTRQMLVDPGIWSVKACTWLQSIAPNAIVELINTSSGNLTNYKILQETGQYSFIHIDGEHSFKQCWKDLELGSRLLSDRGIITVDDFFTPMFPQVTAAVFSYIKEHNDLLNIFLVGPCNKAYLCKPSSKHLYKEFCTNQFMQCMDLRGFPITLAKTTTPEDFDCLGYQPRAWNRDGNLLRGPDWDMENMQKYV